MFIERVKLHEIADLVSTLLGPQGYTCLDADWDAPSRTLRLFVDHRDGVDLDQCAKISGLLVEAPELDALLPFEFSLEISSPGIERPIRTITHFREALAEGCQIDVKLTEKYQNRRKGVGSIRDIGTDDMISMKTAEGPWTFPWNMVLKATKVVDWDKVHERPM